MNEDKAVRYRRQRARFDVWLAVCAAALLSALAFTPAAVGLRELLAALTGSPAHQQGATLRWAFAFVLVLLIELATLTVRALRDVRLEARYRAAKAPSLDKWLARRVVAVPVTAAVMGVLAVVVFWLIDTTPRVWWLWSGALWVGVSAGVTLWAPALAAPFVWPSVPLGQTSLSRRLEAVANRAGLPAPEIHEWRLGADEGRANALLVGVGPRRRILLSTALLADYSEDEIEVIVAHELGHVVHRHLWWDLSIDAVTKLVALGSAALVLARTWAWLGLEGPGDVAALPAGLLAGGAVSLVLAPIPRALSRFEECQADQFALHLTKRPDAFVSALKRLGAHHLADTRRPVWSARLYNSHPSLEARLDFARRWESGGQSSAAAR